MLVIVPSNWRVLQCKFSIKFPTFPFYHHVCTSHLQTYTKKVTSFPWKFCTCQVMSAISKFHVLSPIVQPTDGLVAQNRIVQLREAFCFSYILTAAINPIIFIESYFIPLNFITWRMSRTFIIREKYWTISDIQVSFSFWTGEKKISNHAMELETRYTRSYAHAKAGSSYMYIFFYRPGQTETAEVP